MSSTGARASRSWPPCLACDRAPTAPEHRRPLLGLAAGALVAPPRRRDFYRRDAVEGARLPGDLDAGHDRGLRVDHGRVGFHPALVNAKRHPAAAECSDVDVGGPGDLFEETRIPFE